MNKSLLVSIKQGNWNLWSGNVKESETSEWYLLVDFSFKVVFKVSQLDFLIVAGIGKVLHHAHMKHKFRKCCIIKPLSEHSMHPGRVTTKGDKHFNLCINFVFRQINIDLCLCFFDRWCFVSFIFAPRPLLAFTRTQFAIVIFVFLAEMNSIAFELVR